MVAPAPWVRRACAVGTLLVIASAGRTPAGDGMFFGHEVTEFPIVTSGTTRKPLGITTDAFGNLWFTESAARRIGKLDSNGDVTEYVIANENSSPAFIARAADGNL